MSVEEWKETPMVRDALTAVEMWRDDGTCRRSLHFAIIVADYGIDATLAEAIINAC